jgi:hypothetical protein
MGFIFSNAECVLAWFGPDDGDAEEAFALICKTNRTFEEQYGRHGEDNVLEVQLGKHCSLQLKCMEIAR